MIRILLLINLLSHLCFATVEPYFFSINILNQALKSENVLKAINLQGEIKEIKILKNKISLITSKCKLEIEISIDEKNPPTIPSPGYTPSRSYSVSKSTCKK